MLATDSSSIVLDSTVSQPNSSPPPPMRRAPVTYGRRKDGNPASEPDAARPQTASKRFEDEVIPDSDEFNVPQSSLLTGAGNGSDADDDDDDDDDHDELPGASGKFNFDWKKDLAKIDAMSDDELRRRAAGADDSPMKVDKGPMFRSGSPQVQEHVPTSPAAPLPGLDDVFHGSLSSLTESTSHASLAIPSSPSDQPASRRLTHTHRRQVIEESSDEEPTPKKAASSPNTSPQFPHPITTPKDRSSPTPPTSEGDMSPARTKSKGKARSRTVAPLLFDEEIDSSSAKPSRIANKQPERRKGKAKARKEKPIPKKQQAEMQKETVRLLANRDVSLPTHTKIRPLSSLLAKFSRGVTPPPKESTPAISSDPIQSFSSPSAHTPPPPSRHASEVPVLRTPSPFRPNGLLGARSDPSHTMLAMHMATSSDEEELPTIGNLLREDKAARDKAEKLKELAAIKRRALERNQAVNEARAIQRGGGGISLDSDAEDDDDLVIVDENPRVVAREEAVDRLLRPKPTEGRQRQLRLGLGPSKASRALAGDSRLSATPEKKPRLSIADLAKIARPAFLEGDEKRKGKAPPLTRADMERALLESAAQQSQAEIRKKEEEWMERGGRLKESVMEPKSMAELAEKARQVAEKKEKRMMVDGDSDSEDEDWKPEAADEGMGAESAESADEEGQEEENGTRAPDVDAMDEDEDELELSSTTSQTRARRRSTIRPHTIDSDADSESGNVDDNDNDNLPPPGQPPRQISSEHTTDAELELGEETDKENAKERMFDRGEDKENKAVVRHSTGSTARPSLGLRLASGVFGGENSPPGAHLEDDENAEPRKPLKELLSPTVEADPFSFTPSKRPRAESANVLARMRSPLPPTPLSFGAGSKGPGKRGLSQFFEDEDGVMDDVEDGRKGSPDPMSLQPAALDGGLSQFFASGSAPAPAAALQTPTQDPKPVALGGLADAFGPTQTQDPKPLALGGLADAFDSTQDNSGFDRLRKNATGDLSLTFTTQQLKPALDVDESLKQKAELIFEKEQEYVVEAAAQPARSAKPELYINESGFLTQTRPDVSTPEIYRPSPSQHPNFFRTQTQRSLATSEPSSAYTSRQPLGTLAFSDADEQELFETPSQRPLQRLRRRTGADGGLGVGGYRSSPSRSPSPSPSRPRNAFDVLLAGKGEQREKGKGKEKETARLGRSEFVDADAVESDEDDMFGFGPKRRAVGDEDDEDDEGDDGDKTLEGLVDDAEMSEEVVNKERVLEAHKEHEEQDDAKLEKLAREVAEGKRRTKRRGRHGVDLDESGSEDEDEADRRRRQRIAKKRRIDGDNLDDLANHEETRPFYQAYLDGNADDNAEFAHLLQDDAMDDASDGGAGEDEGGRAHISVAELHQQMREVARKERAHAPIDPHDISWLDAEHSDDDAATAMRVTEIQRPARRSAHAKPADTDIELLRPAGEREPDRQRMKEWAKEERAAFVSAGTGRGGAGSSVTGLGRAKAAAGAARTKARAKAAEGGASGAARKVQKAPSVLLAVGDRRGRFGS